jgi:formate C-acetyltransferase
MNTTPYQTDGLTRRTFLTLVGASAAVPLLGGFPAPSTPVTRSLRRDIVDSPVSVGLHRARVFTRVFEQESSQPWVLRKALAMKEYFATVPLYLRAGDSIAGAISEKPGAMPLMVELGIGENSIYTGENPKRAGYLKGQVPDEIREYWVNRNLWGLVRTELFGQKPLKNADALPRETQYKFISNQGHLSPSYRELLQIGLGGVLRKAQQQLAGATGQEKTAFLKAAEAGLAGLSEWIRRYHEYLDQEAQACANSKRAAELREMSRIAGKVATQPPETFREALQLIWFVHQSIHIEGHGYSCTPDRIDQILFPYYEADCKAGRLDDAEALRLIENFVLKMYDNTFWGPEHHLTQGLAVGGSTPEGRDQTNRLSWLFIEGATNLVLPEPLVWIRWHPNIDQKFFDFCLSRLPRSTCFPMMWNDKVVPEMLMALGIKREDAFNYVPVGCNELGIPGQFYFNPGASANYLKSIELAMTSGKGYQQSWKGKPLAPPAEELKSFDDFVTAFGAYLRDSIQTSFEKEQQFLTAQMRWGQTPLTSCFFEGCLEQGHDLTAGTKYNVLTCGGVFFANAVDCLAAIREVVYQKKQATLSAVAKACAENFEGCQPLRAQLKAAPKHGNDDPALDDIIRLVERLRDGPMKEICRDPRDGSKFGNGHVVRSSAVKTGLVTPATPDGRLAGTPLATSIAASVGCEHSGPTALLNSVCKLDPKTSWQCGYQVNIRFQSGLLADPSRREKIRALLNAYFLNGGVELQINTVDTATLRAAQKNPEQYRDLVVRVAGFSEFFVNLTQEMQNEIIARTEHM